MKCSCESYRLIREQMYDEVIYKYTGFRQLSDTNKLIYLMQCESKLLAKYVQETWNIRKSILFNLILDCNCIFRIGSDI